MSGEYLQPRINLHPAVIQAPVGMSVSLAQRPARRVLVLNAKGGCGKTTIATNLASYYASCGRATALLDHDPQGSSMQWLSLRSTEQFPIHGVAAFQSTGSGVTRSWQMRLPPDIERLILDAPAGIQTVQLNELLRDTDTILVPVLPSPIDIHAASNFIRDLLQLHRVRSGAVRVGVVANRVRANTRVCQSLQAFLDELNIPFVTQLRDTQNYIHSAEGGQGVFEWHGDRAESDRKQWQALIRWIESEE